MKKLIETLTNIWKIEELRSRILYTLGFILIYRFGSYVVLPDVDPSQFAGQGNDEGLLGLINTFAGGAFSRASIFALGIMPYISASIIVQLLGMAVPFFQRLQREGESGRKKINQYTRYLTVVITALQGYGYLQTQVVSKIGPQDGFWYFQSLTVLVTGTMFVMWLGERITDRGIGNGISILIMIGIIARLPFAVAGEFEARLSPDGIGGGLIMLLIEIAILLGIIVVSILLVQGTRKIPVNFAKRIVGNKQYGGQRQYIPLKVNAAGVMPIIFAQAIMLIPITAVGFATNGEQNWIVTTFSDNYGFWYNFVFALLIVMFTYFYTAITVNPNQMAEEMKRNEGFIPGVKPGKRTAEFIDNVMSRITLPGSLFLAFVAILPALAMNIMHVNNEFAQFYGGTSLLILVGVVLDTLQQIESHLLMKQYDGLMKSGRIKGRSNVGMATTSGY